MGQNFFKMKTNKNTDKQKLEKPIVIEIGDALEIIKNEFRPGTNDSIPAVENINTDGV